MLILQCFLNLSTRFIRQPSHDKWFVAEQIPYTKSHTPDQYVCSKQVPGTIDNPLVLKKEEANLLNPGIEKIPTDTEKGNTRYTDIKHSSLPDCSDSCVHR